MQIFRQQFGRVRERFFQVLQNSQALGHAFSIVQENGHKTDRIDCREACVPLKRLSFFKIFVGL